MVDIDLIFQIGFGSGISAGLTYWIIHKINCLDHKVKIIKDNHLPHIYKKIKSLPCQKED